MTVSEAVGSCNTPRTLKSERPPTVKEVGIDTWRLTRYLDDDELAVAKNSCPGPVSDQKVHGHRWGVITGARMLWIEGHPAVERLCPPPDLPDSQARVLEHLDTLGVPIGTDGGVGRLDVTATLRFDQPEEGAALLQAMAMVDVPRRKPAVFGRPPETVYWMAPQGKRMLERIYCKGTEAAKRGDHSAIAPYGQHVRFEAQVRYDRAARMKADVLAEHPPIPAETFKRRFGPVALSSEGLTAATAQVISDRLVDDVESGRLAARTAETLIGYLQAGERLPFSAATHRRRRRELRKLGLVLLNPMEDPIEVDVGAAVEAAMAAWA